MMPAEAANDLVEEGAAGSPARKSNFADPRLFYVSILDLCMSFVLAVPGFIAFSFTFVPTIFPIMMGVMVAMFKSVVWRFDSLRKQNEDAEEVNDCQVSCCLTYHNCLLSCYGCNGRNPVVQTCIPPDEEELQTFSITDKNDFTRAVLSYYELGPPLMNAIMSFTYMERVQNKGGICAISALATLGKLATYLAVAYVPWITLRQMRTNLDPNVKKYLSGYFLMMIMMSLLSIVVFIRSLNGYC